MSDIVKHEKPQLLQVWGQDFEKAQRFAQALIASPIFPKKYKDVGSAIIIIDIAQRLEISPLEVAQNIHIVHDAPVWKSEYVIAQIEASEKYSQTEYVEAINGKVNVGQAEMDNWECTFVATLPNGKKLEGTTVSFKMAVSEGWWTRTGSKWPSMPRQMLRYRAAAFFNRAYPTSRLLGLRPKDEAEDITTEEATVTSIETVPTAKPIPKPSAKVKVTTHEVIDVPTTEEPATVTSEGPKASVYTEDGEEIIIRADGVAWFNGAVLPDGDYNIQGWDFGGTCVNGILTETGL